PPAFTKSSWSITVNALDRDRWNALWRAAGAMQDTAPRCDQLIQLYNEPHRHYHNSRHITDCLSEFDLTRHLAKEPIAVELAIWFHDAIYDPRAADNEERSADLVKQCISEAGLNKTLGDAVAALVLATKQHDNSLHADA